MFILTRISIAHQPKLTVRHLVHLIFLQVWVKFRVLHHSSCYHNWMVKLTVRAFVALLVELTGFSVDELTGTVAAAFAIATDDIILLHLFITFPVKPHFPVN